MKVNAEAGGLPDPVTGTAPGPGPGIKDHPHHDGFSAALQDAIDQIERQGWPKPASYDVTVQFAATIDVENPGGISEYRVIVR